jgi:hypothetical protein
MSIRSRIADTPSAKSAGRGCSPSSANASRNIGAGEYIIRHGLGDRAVIRRVIGKGLAGANWRIPDDFEQRAQE